MKNWKKFGKNFSSFIDNELSSHQSGVKLAWAQDGNIHYKKINSFKNWEPSLQTSKMQKMYMQHPPPIASYFKWEYLSQQTKYKNWKFPESTALRLFCKEISIF